MHPAPLPCSSAITEVEVYARGALVTRRAQLPADLPAGPITLALGGITPTLDPGSLRARAEGGRDILSLHTALHIPEAAGAPGEAAARVLTLEDDARRAQLRLQEVRHAADLLRSLQPAPPRPGGRRRPVGRAVQSARAACALIDHHVARLDARARTSQREVEDLQRELEDARRHAAQRPQAELAGDHPTRTVLVTLDAGDAPLDALEITYAVGAARWWPAYTARLNDGASRAELTLEAFVAQATLEDWSHVRLALSTADLHRELQLPELHSLRLGRAQPPRPTGFRAPPQGLDALFEGYDRATRDAAPPEPPAPPPPQRPPYAAPEGGVLKKREAASVASDSALADEAEEQDVYLSMPAAAPQAMPARKSASLFSGFGGAAGGAPIARGESRKRADKADAPSPPPSHDPGDAWLRFDDLILEDPRESAARGRLTARPPLPLPITQARRQLIEETPTPHLGKDPLQTRGEFDHRFLASATVDLPGDALPRRIDLQRADASATTRLRAVPVHEAAVWREVTLNNPFPSPLLAGPVDVFIGGALLMTSSLSAVGPGGAMTFGLGVEERVRVHRDVRAQESTRGVFGGTTAVEHTVTVEITSNLPAPVPLDLLERLPVYGNSDIEIKLLRATPEATPYDQADRGAPLEGGLAWTFTLEPGAQRKIELRYELAFSSKYELHGGNRRA